jgi:hypothetical protein
LIKNELNHHRREEKIFSPQRTQRAQRRRKNGIIKKKLNIFLLTVHFLNPGNPVNPVNPD